MDREILLEKLDRYGIRGKANDLMKSYFENRYQRVRIGNIISSSEITKKGLPQGSSLAPLLYILYTNDLESDLKETDTLKYADDTVIYKKGERIREVIQVLENELNKAAEWYDNNGLEINERKTELVIFLSNNSRQKGKVKEIKLKIKGKEIRVTGETKYLGLTLEGNMSWNSQTNEIIKKIRSLMPIIRKIRDVINEPIKKEVYYAIIESRLKYGIEIWGSMGIANMEKVQRAQNKILRVLYNLNSRKSMKSFYQEREILSVQSLHLTHMTVKAWQLLKNERESEKIRLNSLLPDVEGRTRNDKKHRMEVQKWKTNWGKKLSGNRMAEILNDMENEIGMISKKGKWSKCPKNKIKKVWLNKERDEIRKKYW